MTRTMNSIKSDDDGAMVDANVEKKKKKKRPICSRCNRPEPKACICVALPDVAVRLKKCRLIVLQHPHESRRKNRSLPLVEQCLNPDHIHTVVARRFGDQTTDSSAVTELLCSSERNVLLVYPSPDAISLTEGLEQIRQRRKKTLTLTDEKDATAMIVLLLDATWKYAREMYKANEAKGQYPSNMICVKLTAEDWKFDKKEFRPCRFDIRTPPSPEHLSTAECIAWVVSVIEEDPSLYTTLMKPLDLMVKKWKSFHPSYYARSFTDG